jgi:hypothetical protein
MALKTIEDKVIALLEEFPMLRSCDRMLIATYMRTYHKIESFKEYALQNPRPTSVESIRRVRQKIQEAGLYLANEETKRMRDNMIDKYKDYSRTDPRQSELWE